MTERGRSDDGAFEVTVRFEGGGEHPATVSDPLAGDPATERLLAWYFEEHLRYPFLDRDRERAAVEAIGRYGGELFGQAFAASEDCSQEFRRLRDGGLDGVLLEIVGSAELHRLHWEALREGGEGTPLGARAPIVRRVANVVAGFDVAESGPRLNLLVVTARPHGARDVGYRTISRPLLAALRQARIPVSVDLVRPGSWRALKEHLREATVDHGSGWYGIVHFDVHGAVASIDELRAEGGGEYLLAAGGGSGDASEGAYLFFETTEVGVAEPVATSDVANLLVEHRIPVAVLNACQSAMQTRGSEASLAQRLVEAGVPVAVGMAYSVTVSAAELMMPVVYSQLADGKEIIPAIHAGRRELFEVRGRQAYFDQRLDLEDWILPVAFSQRPVALQPAPATPEEEEEILAEEARLVDESEPEYGFVGRDLDVQAIERLLLGEGAHNELLVWGMAGAGKSTLLKHLGWWWQATGLVDRVFNFSYENRAWTVDQILQSIVGELLEGREQVLAQALPPDPLMQRVVKLLRADRHLLVLDNAESITAAPASIPHSLPEEERTRLSRFLSRLRGGRTLVLIGSRGPERWLAPESFASNAHELGGLDPQASSILQERIISRHGGGLPESEGERKALRELVEMLGGFPLALTVVLPAIATTPPSVVLAELRRGGDSADPAQTIQRAVEFSHGRLDPTTQNSLLVLAPFTGVVPRVGLEIYRDLLGKQEATARLGALDLEGALAQAINVGLASPDARSPNHIRLQPLFPYFLRTRITDQPELAAAVAEAHHDLYQQLGPSLHALLISNEPSERLLGKVLMQAEYANLTSALEFALTAETSLSPLVRPLEEFLDQTHQEHTRQRLLEQVIEAVGEPEEADRRLELATMHNLAGVAALARHSLEDARAHHEAELALYRSLDDIRSTAITHHQLGIVAQEQRRFEEAEEHYKEALEIKLEHGDHKSAAKTYHQLGRVAQEQRRFEEAEENYQKALKTKLEFKDRHSAAITHHQLGVIAQQQRRFEEAEEHYKQALDIFDEFKDRYEKAGTYHQLGIVVQRQGRLKEAEEHYREALEIKLEFNDRHSAASTYHQLGIVAQTERRFEEAEAHYQKALELKLEFKDRYSAAITYHQLGIVAQEQRRFEEAIERYEKALEIKLESGDRHSAASTYHQLGRVAQEQERFADAEAHYTEALEIFSDSGDRYETAGPHHQLGIVAQLQGRFEEAEAHYREALELKLEFKDRHSAAITYHQLGAIAQERERFSEAEEMYRKALEIFGEFDDRLRIASAQSQLAILLTDLGRTGEAVGLSLAALGTRLELTGRWSLGDARTLLRQREALGAEEFRAAVVRASSEKTFEQLIGVLDEVDQEAEVK